jgi:cytochrome c peroxidase
VVELAVGTVLVASPASGTLGTLGRGAREPGVVRLAPSDAYLLKHDSVALAQRMGERGFYEGTRAGISCQSCHLHADSDHASYNLGDQELLPTLRLRGLLGTAPYLRDGSYPTLADLDHVAQERYRGYLRRAPGRPQTLGAFLENLPRDPTPAADLAAQRRGVQVFVRASCTTCHAFPAFTSLGQHRAAEVFPGHEGASRYAMLDVPSLLSVGSSGPYLSDGRASTLEAVLTEHNRRNHHGDTAKLTAAERADLVAFLEAL